MKTWVHSVIVLLACLVGTACDKGTAPLADDDPAMVNLSLDFALTDDSAAAAATDDEKMHTLRIVVVRPDGEVEANRYVQITKAVVTYGYETFKVRANETKRVYLFANENSTKLIDGGKPVGDTWEFLRAIRPGTKFPADEIAGLTVELDGPSAQLAGPLPMTESHEVEVGDKDQACTLFVTRAAVKFSIRIVNRGTAERRLTGLALDKMAGRAYYMPRDAVYDTGTDAEGNTMAITSYTVPADPAYYRFRLASAELPLALPAGTTEGVALRPIYLLEGKYAAPAGSVDAGDPAAPARNYRILLSLDGREDLLAAYLPNLPQLPRNTHAVVTLTIGPGSELTCTVDVVPYGEVVLDPSFGI